MKKQILYLILCYVSYEIVYRVMMYLAENVW